MELLALLDSLPPLLHSACLSHATPQMSAQCASVEQLSGALRAAAAVKDGVLLSSFPKAQQLALERLAQYNRQRQLT